MTPDHTMRQMPLIYMAVQTSAGIHVTPQICGRWADAFWFASSRSTAVAEAARKTERVGGLTFQHRRWQLSTGRLQALDPLNPVSLARALGQLGPGDLGASLTALGLNLLSALSGQMKHPLDALRRVGLLNGAIYCYRPENMASIHEDGSLGVRGDWQSRVASSNDDHKVVRPPRRSLRNVPEDLASLADATPARAVLGWRSRSGPVALPCLWDPDGYVASVGRQLFDLTGSYQASSATITFVASDDDSIRGQSGLMLKGRGQAQIQQDLVRISFDPERASFWSEGNTGSRVLKSKAEQAPSESPV